MSVLVVTYSGGMANTSKELVVEANTDAVSFNCNSHGFPIPIVTWKQEEQILKG